MKIVLVEPLTISQELLHEFGQKIKEAGHDFIAYDNKPASVEEWVKRSEDADVLMLANTPMPEEVLENPNLEYINIAFTGVDHVPVAKAKDKGILVSNAAGYSDQGVAELVIGMTINLLRQIKQGDAAIRQGGKTADFLGCELAGRIVGIIGTGKIGVQTAKLFKAFGAKLIGTNRSENPAAVELGLEYKALDDVLAEADIVSLHLPLTDDTRAYLGADEFKKMKETALLINCARGPIIDNDALAEALKAGELAGAGIDVFDQEPPLDESEALFGAPNAVLTPHIGFFTKEAMEKRADIVFANTMDFLNGDTIKTLL